MPNLPLTSGAQVSRTGGTVGWSGLAGAVPYTSATYEPGDKSQYARFKVAPGSPLASLPAEIVVDITADFSPLNTGTQIVDDTIEFGDSTAPTGGNVALLEVVGGIRHYILSTSTITLADLNAGSVYLWLGYKAYPDTYDPTDYAFAYGGVGLHNHNGAITSWAGAPPFSTHVGVILTPPDVFAEETGTLVVTVTGPDGPMYATVTVVTQADATSSDLFPPPDDVTVQVSDGYGGNQSRVDGQTGRLKHNWVLPRAGERHRAQRLRSWQVLLRSSLGNDRFRR
jgi:hypothetical protein